MSRSLGNAAEDTACAFLQAQGCNILARNWHSRHGEIDIIAEQDGCVLFVEVKYRKTPAYGGAAYSITPSKLAKLHTTAEQYLQSRYDHPPCRLDAILIEGNQAPVWIQNITG